MAAVIMIIVYVIDVDATSLMMDETSRRVVDEACCSGRRSNNDPT